MSPIVFTRSVSPTVPLLDKRIILHE
uniref:Uncharacterized protein n=1 Tax=Anguilla anguilla TaxID=7936 RepID=A0A0E9TAZ9_ANGAN